MKKSHPQVWHDQPVIVAARDTHFTKPCILQVDSNGDEIQTFRLSKDEARYLFKAWGIK